MEYFLVLGIFEGLFLGVLLLFKKAKMLHDFVLSGYLLFLAIHLCLFWLELYNFNNDYPFPGFILTRVPPALLHGPFLWLYVFILVKGKDSLKPIHLLHLIPFIAILISMSINIFSLGTEEKLHAVINDLVSEKITFKIFMPLILISGPGYIIWCLCILRQHKLNILNRYSYTEKIDLKWLRYLLSGLGIWWGLVFIVGIIDMVYDYVELFIFSGFIFILASLFILFIGFFGIKQGSIFSTGISVNLEDVNKQKINKPMSDDNVDSQLLNRLIKIMEDKKPYLNDTLKIDDPAQLINVHTKYLSKIINSKLNKNFFKFVNEYRLEEFKQKVLLSENDNLKIIAIAFDCGFNSKASFYRIFKESNGVSPSDYKIKHVS